MSRTFFQRVSQRVSVALGIGVLASCAPSANAADRLPAAGQPPLTETTSADHVPMTAVDSDVARADRYRVQGSDKARVWLVMASDFECPFCKEWHDETYPLIVREYVKTGKIRLAYVNFPLCQIVGNKCEGTHPHAMEAAEAAMCAAAQDRFWPMHDALFATQGTWAPRPNPTSFLDSLAVKVGVNAAQWRRCVSTHAMRALVEGDRDRSTKGGVKSTPSFFVGSQLLTGADKTFGLLRPVLDAALAKPPSPAAPRVP